MRDVGASVNHPVGNRQQPDPDGQTGAAPQAAGPAGRGRASWSAMPGKSEDDGSGGGRCLGVGVRRRGRRAGTWWARAW